MYYIDHSQIQPRSYFCYTPKLNEQQFYIDLGMKIYDYFIIYICG